jgi:hypothetical protein
MNNMLKRTPFFPDTVFDSYEQYEKSMEHVVHLINSGAIQPREVSPEIEEEYRCEEVLSAIKNALNIAHALDERETHVRFGDVSPTVRGHVNDFYQGKGYESEFRTVDRNGGLPVVYFNIRWKYEDDVK